MGDVLNRDRVDDRLCDLAREPGSAAGPGWRCCWRPGRVYFYAHYAFASITAHMLAMFPPFVVMLTGLGTPPALAVYTLACMANLTAGLTHYGTTTAPIVFAEGYVSQRDWWRVGLAMSAINIAIVDDCRLRLVEVLGFW